MGKNFASIGIIVGALDRGFNKVVEESSKRLGGLSEGMKDTEKTANNTSFSAFTDALNALQLGNITDKLDSFREGVSGFQDTGSEQLQAIDKFTDASAQLQVSYAGNAGAAKKASSMISKFSGVAGANVEEVSEVLNEMRQRMDIDTMSESMEDFFELIQNSGTDAGGFSDALGNMRKSFNLSRADTKKLVGSFVAVGGSVGQSKEALNAMAGITEKLSDSFGQMGIEVTSDEFIHAAQGSIKLAAAMKTVGISMDKGVGIVDSVIDKFTTMSLSLEDMKLGLGGNLDEFEEFGKGGIGLQKSLEMMKKSPAEAAMSFAKMGQDMVKAGPAGEARFARFRKFLATQFGPDFRFFIDKVVAEGTEKTFGVSVPKSVGEAEKAMKGFNKTMTKSGARTAKKLETARENFDIAMGKIGLSIGDGRNGAIARIGAMQKSVKKLANEDSMKGTLLKGLLAIKTQGFLGVLPVMDMFEKRFKNLGKRENSKVLETLGEGISSMKDKMKEFMPFLSSMGMEWQDLVPVLLATNALMSFTGLKLSSFTGPLKSVADGVFRLIGRMVGWTAATNAYSVAAKGASTPLKGLIMGTKAFSKAMLGSMATLAGFAALIGIVYAIGSNAMRAWGDESLSTSEKFRETGTGALTDILGFFTNFFGVSKEMTRGFVEELGSMLGRGIQGYVKLYTTPIGWIVDFIGNRIDDISFFAKSIVNILGAIPTTLTTMFKEFSLRTLIFGSDEDKDQMFSKIKQAAAGNFGAEIAKAGAERDKMLKDRKRKEKYDAALKLQQESDMAEMLEKEQNTRAEKAYKSQRKSAVTAAAAGGSGLLSGLTGGGAPATAAAGPGAKVSGSVVQAQVQSQLTLTGAVNELSAIMRAFSTQQTKPSTGRKPTQKVQVSLKGDAERMMTIKQNKKSGASKGMP